MLLPQTTSWDCTEKKWRARNNIANSTTCTTSRVFPHLIPQVPLGSTPTWYLSGTQRQVRCTPSQLDRQTNWHRNCQRRASQPPASELAQDKRPRWAGVPEVLPQILPQARAALVKPLSRALTSIPLCPGPGLPAQKHRLLNRGPGGCHSTMWASVHGSSTATVQHTHLSCNKRKQTHTPTPTHLWRAKDSRMSPIAFTKLVRCHLLHYLTTERKTDRQVGRRDGL